MFLYFDDYWVIVFDYVGVGGFDFWVYDFGKYDLIDGYVFDVLEILE